MSNPLSKSRTAIAEEAATWFVDWRESPPSRTDKARFADWLAESPVHVEEYLAIAQIYGVLAQVQVADVTDVETLVDDTIVALHGDSISDPAPAPDHSRHRRWEGLGLAATVLIAVLSAALFYADLFEEPTTEYVTGLGEQRSVLLDDGSMVSLNTQSRLEVAYSDSERRVRLSAGEALFDVEEDLARPFLVETASARIRVTGTQFNVYQQNGATAVTVIEGTVEVAPKAQPAARRDVDPDSQTPSRSGAVATLAVGEQAVVRSGSVAIEATRIANLEPVTAWTDRRLVFSETPLSQIVEEFNRYNHQRLVLDDATVAELELSGVFSTHDPESLILFLERIANIEVTTLADGSEIHVRSADTTP